MILQAQEDVEDIELDISKYSIADIEHFLGLDTTNQYSERDISDKVYGIRDQVLNEANFNSQFKNDFLEFISTAQKRLVDTKIKPNLSRENETPSKNLVNNRVITKCLPIDSRFRDNVLTTNSSDFIVELPLKLSNVVSMQLSSIEFPISFYGISASYGNNFLNISLDYLIPSDKTTIFSETRVYTIPDGNYNTTDLIRTLNNLLHGNADREDRFKNIRFSVDLNSNSSGTGKVTVGIINNIEKIRNLGISFSKDSEGDSDAPFACRLGSNLGFINSNYTGSLSYTSESVIDPFGIRYFYLAIDDYNTTMNNQFLTAFNRSIANPDTLARIAVSGTFFTVLTTNDLKIVTEPREYFVPTDIERLHIRVFDEYGRSLDMNNTNFSFCLTFKLLCNL